MKTVVKINGIMAEMVGDAVFRDLCTIYPQGNRGRWFECSLSQDDSRAQAVIDRLARGGFQPWSDHFRKRLPSEYSLDLRRTYALEDFQDFTLLEPRPKAYFEGLTRDGEGRIELSCERFDPNAEIALAFGSMVVVSPRIREEIEAEGLRHAVFKPTVLIDDGSSPVPWESHGEPYWELTSEFLLPPISPSRPLLHEDGSLFTGDHSKGCYIREGLHKPPELLYRSTDLVEIGTFDFARTHEYFGPKGQSDDDRSFVASRKFYDFCSARGLCVDWIPVRTEQ